RHDRRAGARDLRRDPVPGAASAARPRVCSGARRAARQRRHGSRADGVIGPAGAQAPAARRSDLGDYRRNLIQVLFSRMFSERLGDLARRVDAPFLGGGAGGGSLTTAVDTYSLSARVEDGRIVEGLSAVLVEARRVVEFGFYESELERAKRWLSSSYSRV